MTVTKVGTRTVLLHPIAVFSAVWLSVVLLYSLHLSRLLLYSTSEVLSATSYIWVPFVTIVVLYSAFHHMNRLAYRPEATKQCIDFELLERRLTLWFRIWLVVSAAEIVISGGIPIIWLVRGSAKTYVDFGIPSLHGLVNSLLVSIAVCRVALYFLTGKWRHLKIPAFVLAWSVLVVTRQLMLVSLLEYVVVFLSVKKIGLKTVARVVVGFVTLIFVFGILGDMRSGSEAFRLVAQPTDRYPDWLPSGVLWVYIYVTTPINNLIYTMHSVQPESNFLFPNTAATLFPSVIRSIIYGSQVGQAESGNLVTQAFNVSTAYVGPYQDYGIVGMILFSLLAGFACQFFWYRSGLRDILIFSVLTQCTVLTLFFNLFLALPVITQVFWLGYFFMPKIVFGKKATPLPLSSDVSR
jgi:oligosaccharide repeat unit polymerase